jgi:predicted nucleic acid-binding protein
MIFLDTSAAIKLVRAEDESPVLRTWLAERGGTPLVASALLQAAYDKRLLAAAEQVGLPVAAPGA